MIRSRWLNCVRRTTNPSGSGRRENSAIRRTTRLHVETLEDRTLFSVNVLSKFKGLDTTDAGGIVDHVPATIFSGFPKLTRIHDVVRDDARVRSWYAKSQR